MMKLALFAYTRETFTIRKIEHLAEEKLYARWLKQERVPTFRIIARFCVSNDVQELTNKGLDQLTEYLPARNLIDAALFIDRTKTLADANKTLILEALTAKGNLRKITVNPAWEYHKEKQKEGLSMPEIQKIYGRERLMWKQSSDL